MRARRSPTELRPAIPDARDNTSATRKRKNDYGFNIGGPIWLGKLYDGHGKTFFFFNFEQFRETQFIKTGIATVPTLAYRRGDFSQALLPQLIMNGQPAVDPLGRPVVGNAIYDPRTTRFAPNGSVIRDQFPNNTIPPELMD